ncbi:MAG: hypothetical protein ABFE16_00260 [Armatimonadia bacterium]
MTDETRRLPSRRWTGFTVAISLVALQAVLVTCTSLGVNACVWASAADHDEVALLVVRCLEVTRRGSDVGWRAHRAEVAVLTIGALHGRPRDTWEHALEACEKYRKTAQAYGNAQQAARAAYGASLVCHFQKRPGAAVAALDEGLSGQWDEPWAAGYESYRVAYLTRAGRYQEAVDQFAHYARHHSGGRGAERAVDWVWHAYCQSDRAKEGWSTLSALHAKHPGTPLASAIQGLGGGAKDKPLPTTPPPDATPEVP